MQPGQQQQDTRAWSQQQYPAGQQYYPAGQQHYPPAQQQYPPAQQQYPPTQQHYPPTQQEQEQQQQQQQQPPPQPQQAEEPGAVRPQGMQPLEFDMETVTAAPSVVDSRMWASTVGQQEEKLQEAARLMLGSADDWEGYVGIVRPGAVKKNQHKERYMKLTNGSLQFFEKREGSSIVRQDLVRAIRSIWWSGIEVQTPLERFRMYYAPGKRTATPEDPEKTHQLFQALGKYTEAKAADVELKQQFIPDDALGGCMEVGELGDGRVLYRPQEGMLTEERDNDILRLSIAMQLVEDEALKANMNFTGWVAKSSRSEGGGRNKERYLKVADGHLHFHEESTSTKPRKMIGVSTIKDVQLWQLTIVTEYDTFKLCNTTNNPAALGELVKKLEATHALIKGDVLKSYSTAFDAFDTDNDGTLTREEVHKYLGDPQLVQDFFQKIDVDADGTVTRDEFMKFVTQRQRTFTGQGSLQRVAAVAGEAEPVLASEAGMTAGEEAPQMPASVDGSGHWSGRSHATGQPSGAPFDPASSQLQYGHGYGVAAGYTPPTPQQQQQTGGAVTLDI